MKASTRSLSGQIVLPCTTTKRQAAGYSFVQRSQHGPKVVLERLLFST